MDKNVEDASHMSLRQLKAQVQTKGDWCYKNNGALIAAVGRGDFGSDLLQEFGNVHFGIVAQACPGVVSLTFALSGGGYYQAFHQGGRSPSQVGIGIMGNGIGNNYVARNLTNAGFSWGDNPGYSKNILWGWDYGKAAY